MRTRDEVSGEKVRGGFYSPPPLVRFCLDRIEALIGGAATGLTVLEPSAGDGAFVRGLASHPLKDRISHLVAVELLEAEAAKCENELRKAPFDGMVRPKSFIPWAALTDAEFDVAVGNPPFVRFQFVDEVSKRETGDLARRLGVSFRGVSNLWLPVTLGALGRLRRGGAFAFIVPAESFTGVSASRVRAWLIANADGLQFDLFPPGSFPGVLQEVVVMSGLRRGRARAGSTQLRVREHRSDGTATTRSHTVENGLETWTRYLLTPRHLHALAEARDLAVVRRLSEVARFEVSTVTGANAFFTIDEATLNRYRLAPWALPLLPRSRHAPGLILTAADHERLAKNGINAWLVHFAESKPSPIGCLGAEEFIASGEALRLHHRYKTRIRDPWYRVPLVAPGRLMLSKRSHRYPRVILNQAGVVTTDTIYRGSIKPGYELREADFVAGFHNSLTLLTAEIEGRSFGGGVLELVPSETARLLVPLVDGFGEELPRLHDLAATTGERDGEALVEETDLLLKKHGSGLTDELLETLRDGRLQLLQRRLDRN